MPRYLARLETIALDMDPQPVEEHATIDCASNLEYNGRPVHDAQRGPRESGRGIHSNEPHDEDRPHNEARSGNKHRGGEKSVVVVVEGMKYQAHLSIFVNNRCGENVYLGDAPRTKR